MVTRTLDGERAGVVVGTTPKSRVRSRDAEDIRRRFAENAFVTDSGVHVRFLFLGVTSALEGWLPSMAYASRGRTGGYTGW